MPNNKKQKTVSRYDMSLFLRRTSCYVLAVIMALCVIMTTAVGIATGLLRAQSFVQKRFDNYNAELLEEVNNAITAVAEDTGIPAKAYTDSIQSGHIQTALHQVSNNIVKGFKTDYTESTYLYGYYHTGLYNYCKENGIPITDDELVKDACFAVDVFNDTVGDESTSNIVIFELTYTKNPLIVIIASIVIFILCLIAIDFITYGKHKKFDYMGVGLILAGESLIILPAFALIMKYTSTLHFMDIDVYNMALADVLNDIMKIYMAVGAVILIIGIIVVSINYAYYYRKTRSLKTEHDIRKKLVEEQKAENEAYFNEVESKQIERAIEENDKEIKEE